MPEESVFRGILYFFDKVGVYDVILPFLLVFTIMYAIFEKTKVLGFEEVGGKKFPRRNLNSMASFVFSLFVIASAQLVALINEAMANVVILVMVGVSFLLLVGLFRGDEEMKLKDSYMPWVMILMAMGVILIFLHAIPVGNSNVLSFILGFLALNWQSDWVGALILIVLLIWFMIYITSPPSSEGDAKKAS